MTLARRQLLKSLALVGPCIGLCFNPIQGLAAAEVFTSKRPLAKKFTSKAVEETIQVLKAFLPDKELAWLFQNCYPNTLDTTVDFEIKDGKPDTFVITGDIKAMWLRDSSAQVWPYLSLASKDAELKQLLEGVLRRQAKCITIDPYANAFNKGKSGGGWKSDRTEMKPELHERKWEIDSLCYPVRLAYGYWKQTGDAHPLDETWKKAAQWIVATFKQQQRKDDNGPYKFQRNTEVPTDTLPMGGYGNPTRKIGLIHSMFRPSDDACTFPFLIPANLFAVRSLFQLEEMALSVWKDQTFAKECKYLALEVQQALEQYGTIVHPLYGKIYAYEVDGYGNALLMDDANVPSLLSLPYLVGMDPADVVYKNTRAFVLSLDNPFFYSGSAAQGIGGPHVGADMVWPLGIIMRGMTSVDASEVTQCIKMLKASHAGTGFMHEAFHKNNPKEFTRTWFAWANTLFGEFILKVYHENPQLLQQQF